MKKKEIQNIISEGWSVRRFLQEERRIAKNKKTKEWVEREKLGLNSDKDRQSHYLPQAKPPRT